MQIEGKNVVIVGGFGGIGLKTCQAITTKKPKTLTILDKEENSEAFKELKTHQSGLKFYKFNAALSQDSMQKVLDKVIADIGHIDIFIYGAGICNEADYELTMKVNFLGLVNATVILLPHMDRSKGGRGGLIVTIASVTGLEPFSSTPVYSASKAAVVSFTRSLSHSIIQDRTGVLLICICPGITNTPILNNPTTFLNFDSDLSTRLQNIPKQSAEECARNIVKAMTEGANGSIWILNYGSLELVELKHYCSMPKI